METPKYPNISAPDSSCLELPHFQLAPGHAAPRASTDRASDGRDDGGLADPGGSGGHEGESDEVLTWKSSLFANPQKDG